MIPNRYSWIWRANPLTSILQLIQNGFLGTPFPEASILIFNLIIIFIVFVVGVRTFNNESKDFDDWL